MAFEDDRKRPGAVEDRVSSDALALLTQLFNARQRRQYAESELENARETLKLAKREEENIMLSISGAVPKLHAIAKEKDMLHKGLEEMPPLLDWRNAADTKKPLATNGDPGDENDHRGSDPAEPTQDGNKIRFGGRYVAVEREQKDEKFNEYALTCQDCVKEFAHVKIDANLWQEIPQDSSFIIEVVKQFSEATNIHDELYHSIGGGPKLP